MERPRMLAAASSSRDPPADDYASFSGYRSPLSYYSQHSSFDTGPLSRERQGSYSGHLRRENHKEPAGDGISGDYSYTSSYDEMRRRYGDGFHGGSYLSEAYRGETFSGTSSLHNESSKRPSTSPLMSDFLQDFNGRRPHASTDGGQWMADKLYTELGTQNRGLEFTSKSNDMLYEHSILAGNRQSSELDFHYPVKDYMAYWEQGPGGYNATQDRLVHTRSDDKSMHMLASKYDSTLSGLHLPSSGSLSDWNAGGIQRAHEYDWKGFSSFSKIGHEQAVIDRSGKFMDGISCPESRGYDKLSAGAIRQAELDLGQEGHASSLLHAKSIVNGGKGADTKEALIQVQVDNAGAAVSVKEGKKRKTRWEPVVENEKSGQVGATKQKKKSRWSDEKSSAEEVSLPDVIKEIPVETSDIVALRARLIVINKILQSGQVLGNSNADRSPSPEPVFDNFGFRVNTREHREREKLNKERQRIMSRLSELMAPMKMADDKSSKCFKKIYIPVDKYPYYNFIGLILGPRGNTQKQMEKVTGARIFIRGKGLVKEGASTHSMPGEDDNLHVLIEADNEDSVKRAAEMVEKLLVPVEDGQNEHKRAQLRELASLNRTTQTNEICGQCKGPGHVSKNCPSTIMAVGPSVAMRQNIGAAIEPVNDNDDNRVIFVSSLPVSVDDIQLSNLFFPFGQVVHAKVVKHPTTGISQGCGFVKLLDAVDAAQAVALMNGYQVDGKVLAVKFKSEIAT